MTSEPLPHALSEEDLNLIHQATTDDELEIMKTRLKMAKSQGADIQNLMVGDLPVVLYLIKENRLQSIKILADLGLNLHATDPRHNNALHYCAQKATEYLSFFIQQGVSVHHRNKQGCQPLAHAGYTLWAMDAHTRISNLKALLDAGANINDAMPVEGFYRDHTVLHWAISPRPDSLKTLDFLMQQPELEIHNVGGSGDSALHIAAAQGSLEVTKHLINTGRFDLDQVNRNGSTALELASCNVKEDVLRYLTDLYAVWAEKKELVFLTSQLTHSRTSAVGDERVESIQIEGSVASGKPSSQGFLGSAESATSRPPPKTRSL